MLLINWNGKIVPEGEVIISPNNRSFRYGDGCFETIKVIDGNIILKELHFRRLFSSLETLKFAVPEFLTSRYFTEQISSLVQANQHSKLSRVRLVVYRGDGGLYDLFDHTPHFIIQSWPGNTISNYLNKRGFALDFFRDAVKTSDRFSHIKSNNYLGYVMGAIWAQQNKFDDAILCNAENCIADATIANVFIVSNGIIKTPSLLEGCVNGVMKTHLIDCLKNEGIPFKEVKISIDELMNAAEVFLTNANYGIRWVQKVANSSFGNSTSSFLHEKFIIPLFQPATI